MSTEPTARFCANFTSEVPRALYVAPADDDEPWYDLPVALVDDYRAAERAWRAAEGRIVAYVRDNGLQEQR